MTSTCVLFGRVAHQSNLGSRVYCHPYLVTVGELTYSTTMILLEG